MLEILKKDGRETAKLFFRPFYVLLPLCLFLMVEALFKNTGTIGLVSISMPLLILTAMGFLVVAIFKLYHHYIFKHADYMTSFHLKAPYQLVLSKLALSSLWLAAFYCVCTIYIKVHLLIAGDALLAGAGMLQDPIQILEQAFGTGLMGIFSILTMLIQSIALISTLYLACTLSHLKFFETYKTLAGIFALVAIFFAEGQLMASCRILVVNGIGGVENILTLPLLSSMTVFFSIELFLTLLFIAIKTYFTCVFLLKRI